MAKYKAYPEYKDSGVEWLGCVPTGWLITELKRYSWVKGGYAFSSDSFISFGEPVIRIGDISQDGSINLENCKYVSHILAKQSRSYTVRNGELLMAMTGATIGKAGFYECEFPALINQRVGLFKVLDNLMHYRFLWYTLKSYGYQEYIKLTAFGGAQPNISDVGMVGYRTTVPSLQEQSRIASFLDHETAKIDNLIENQQQLIELLKEKRQAVISHAVTKGLNSDVPMKDSGVEWLGEVPEHWGVTRLKYECRNIVDCPHSTPNYTDEGEYPAIRTADIFAGYLDLENCRRVTESVYDERNFRLIPRVGDIIYSREGERFGIGAPIPEGAKVCLAQRVMLFRAKSTPGYLMWALNSSSTYTQAQQDCIGSTSPHVNVDTIKNFILAWPPENEREEISNFIHQTLDSVESLTAHLTEKLTLLQERRTALISAAVTGKIDVRDWVAPDTQDVEEPQEATA
ncbi:restriction endonuclease subunit S [Enterobacter asburiae]|nr:restriction endonuclease subunit S [Enterobacter asburiae]